MEQIVHEDKIGFFPNFDGADFIIHADDPGRISGSHQKCLANTATGVLHHISAGNIQSQLTATEEAVGIKYQVLNMSQMLGRITVADEAVGNQD